MPLRSLRRGDRNPKPGALAAGGFRPKTLRFGDVLGNPSRNYFGDGSDGDCVISANTYLSNVLNGDMVVRHYKNLTVNAGCTLTTATACRGLLLYVNGDLTVNGTIRMTNRGCKANPLDGTATAETPAPPSDGIPVPAEGLVLRRRQAGGAGVNLAARPFQGCGPAASQAEAKQPKVRGGLVLVLPPVGGEGGAAVPGHGNGNVGGSKANAPGGGASGCCYYTGGALRGGTATCFSGGCGSGGDSGVGGVAPSDFGGAGGNAGGSTGGAGGAGNPGGAHSGGGSDGLSGTGGLLILIVRGNVSIASGAYLLANGNGGGSTGVPGGGSGGGLVVLLRAGTLTNNGSIAASGGVGGDGSPWGLTAQGGGVGAVINQIIDP